MAAKRSNGFQVLMGMLSQLTEEEKDDLREQLGPINPCSRLGHKYKTLRQVKQGFWEKVLGEVPKSELFCERCGSRITR